MKLKLSLKSSVRRALSPLSFLCALALFSGCTSSTEPTYTEEKVESAIQDLCKNEYKMDVKVKVAGSTLWVYLPVENIFIPSEKPEKNTEHFKIEENKLEFQDNYLKSEYAIKRVPPKVQLDNYQINKDVSEKLMNAWKAVRRVVFSMKQAKDDGIKFFCVVTADIKDGFEIITVTYYQDLKKISYNLISTEEYQHRIIQDTNIDKSIIGDKDGSHLKYDDITMENFIAGQISHRIKLKFQKPELEKKSADIDKEVLKIIEYTLRIYGFQDFGGVELTNLLTKKKVILNKAAIFAEPNERRF